MSQPDNPGVIKLELKRVDLPELLKFDEMLGTAPVFKACGPQGTARLLAVAQTRRHADGQVIFAEGSPGTSLFVVLRGEVAIGRGQGAEAVEVCTVRKGEFFGEAEVLGPSTNRGTTAIARGQVDVAEFPQSEVAALLKAHFELYGLLRETRDERAKAKDELNDFLNRW